MDHVLRSLKHASATHESMLEGAFDEHKKKHRASVDRRASSRRVPSRGCSSAVRRTRKMKHRAPVLHSAAAMLSRVRRTQRIEVFRLSRTTYLRPTGQVGCSRPIRRTQKERARRNRKNRAAASARSRCTRRFRRTQNERLFRTRRPLVVIIETAPHAGRILSGRVSFGTWLDFERVSPRGWRSA